MKRRDRIVFIPIAGIAAVALFVFVLFIESRTSFIERRIHRHSTPPNAEITERPVTNPKIVIQKRERRLRLYSGEEVVHEYRIGLGFSPEGDKVKKGDGRTPEGDFYVCLKNPKSRFYLALGLSYPNDEDAERGLRDGIVDRRQHDSIVRAIERRRQPPWDTPIGGAILIHGLGSKRDWTLGCVALDNDDMLQLYECVPLGTTVTIHP